MKSSPRRLRHAAAGPRAMRVLFGLAALVSATAAAPQVDVGPLDPAGGARVFRPADVPVGVVAGHVGFEGGNKSRTELPFTDMLKVAHAFEAVAVGDTYPGGATVVPYGQVFTDVDADGYPNDPIPTGGFDYGTYVARGISGRYPAGPYLLTFDGVGAFEFGGDVGDATMLSANQYRLDVTPSGSGIVLRVVASAGGANRVRNVRLVPEALADTAGNPVQRFHPEYLARLATLGPVAMRFVNWKRVTAATVTTLAEETPETYYTYGRTKRGSGVPWGVVAELCAVVGAEPWVNVPYDADLEAYVRPLAALFGDLAAATGLRVHVEYGNEVWNPTYGAQYCWILDDATGCVPCDPADPPPVDGTIQACIAEHNAARSTAIFDVFREEFALRGVETRAVRVLSGWMSNAFYSSLLLDQIVASDTIDVFATQSYFGTQAVRQLGWQELFASTEPAFVNYLHRAIEGQAGGNLRRFVRTNANLVQQLNQRLSPPDDVVLAAYEGGQSLTFDTCDCPGFCPSQSDPTCRAQILLLSQRFNGLNRDPVMQELYAHVFDVWSEFTADEDGVAGLWMHFSLFEEYGIAGQGSWGLFEYFDDPVATAWKLQALLAVQAD